MIQKIKDYLKNLNIEFKTFKHPAVFTVEEADKHMKDVKGIHSKNLFLKGRKSEYFYLVILSANKSLNIKEIEEITQKKIKFANENNLKHFLGLTKGSVSPFGLINDKNHEVKVLIDKEVWDSEFVSFHPNINTETLELIGRGFQKYVNSLKNEVRII